jgi:hypothetical protein
MRATGFLPLLSALLLVLLLGCSSDSAPTAVDGPAFSHTGIPDINGRIFLGTNQRNLCSLFSKGTPLAVRAIPVEASFLGVATAFCPANDFSMPVETGSYRVRVNLPAGSASGAATPEVARAGAFRITNRSRGSITFAPGVFLDF